MLIRKGPVVRCVRAAGLFCVPFLGLGWVIRAVKGSAALCVILRNKYLTCKVLGFKFKPPARYYVSPSATHKGKTMNNPGTPQLDPQLDESIRISHLEPKRGDEKKLGFLSFGHWAEVPGSRVPSAAESLHQAIDLAVGGEDIGLDGAFFRVHHFDQQQATPTRPDQASPRSPAPTPGSPQCSGPAPSGSAECTHPGTGSHSEHPASPGTPSDSAHPTARRSRHPGGTPAKPRQQPAPGAPQCEVQKSESHRP